LDTPNSQPQSQSAPVPVVLPGPLDQYAAEALKADALKLLGEGGEVILDFKEIDRMHAACLQVLIALRNDLERGGRRLSLKSVDPGMRRLFQISGSDDLFQFLDGPA
jgi:anti-anti-sigma factor